MKILEAQDAVLANVEVYEFLIARDPRARLESQRAAQNKAAASNHSRRSKTKLRDPKVTLAKLTADVLNQLEAKYSPLAQKPTPYKASDIARLVEELGPFDLTKAELMMIANLRPPTLGALSCCIDDMEARFFGEQQEEILGIISNVLGQLPYDEQQPQEPTEGPA